MSTDLANINDGGSLVPQVENPYEHDDSFQLVSGTRFLPILQLCSGASDAVKDEHVPMNHYALKVGKDDYIPLSREIDVLFISWRPRALDFSDKSNLRSSFNPKSELFKEIKSRADNFTQSNCGYGPEYLVYIPEKDMFATFFMGSTSARNESRKTHALFTNREGKFVGGPGTLKSRQLQNDKNKWQCPFATHCSTPFDIPSQEKILEVMDDFLHPKEQMGAEKVESTNQVER